MENISRLPVCLECISAMQPISVGTCEICGAFRVAHPEKIADRNILLVDDVLTSTTASECARVLRKAGAEKVWVATVARTLKNTGMNFAAEPDLEIAAQAS